MKRALFALLLLAPAAVEAADYCSQLKTLGVIGKYVAVTSALGSQHESHEGQLLAVEGDALVLNPLPDPETMPPLYEGGKIVQPLKTRIYLNCSHVIGVTVDPMPVGP